MKLFVCTGLLASALSFGLACSSTTTNAAEPALSQPVEHGTYAADWPDLGVDEGRFITIELGDSYETCRHLSPKFPFDSAHARAQDQVQLRALASCLNHPSMADRTLLLVGRADPRGSQEYNQDLGEQRAERIKQLLVQDGVAAERIRLESKGEAGAQGTQPDVSFGYDRRVDIVVQGGVHAPGAPSSS